MGRRGKKWMKKTSHGKCLRKNIRSVSMDRNKGRKPDHIYI